MSWLKTIFGSRQPDIELLKDYSSIHTDFHSHLIPGVDDGAENEAESLHMLRGLASLGFKKIITTPHVMSDHFRNTPEIISVGLDTLRKIVSTNQLNLEVAAAAEYYLDDGFNSRLKNEKLLTLGDNFLLFEVSYINAPDNIRQVVFDMKVQGYKPLLAHPERYPFWAAQFKMFEELKEMDVYFQINTISLTGYYGIGPKKTAEKLIDAGMVNFIGSDMHHVRHLEALKNAVKEKYLAKLVAKGILNTQL